MNLPADDLNSDLQNPRSIRTLLVDDSPVILKTLSLFLKGQDRFTVVGAVPDGRQALHYTVALEPDLILMEDASESMRQAMEDTPPRRLPPAPADAEYTISTVSPGPTDVPANIKGSHYE